MPQYAYRLTLTIAGTIDCDDDDDPREVATEQAREDLSWNREWFASAPLEVEPLAVDRG